MATNPPHRAPLQQPTSYDIAQEQMRHNDAIHWFGEMTCFFSWWRVEDFNNGDVARCSQCTAGVDAEIFEAYKQPYKTKCETCYGTTFEGGIRAIYYRPAIWDLTPVSEDDVTKRGGVEKIRGSIETLSDLHLRDNDVAVRADGTRWLFDQPTWQEITTGFGSQRGQRAYRIQGKVQVMMEDVSSVVYMPFVNFDALNLVGWLPYVPHTPHPLDQLAPAPVLQDP